MLHFQATNWAVQMCQGCQSPGQIHEQLCVEHVSDSTDAKKGAVCVGTGPSDCGLDE